MGARFHWRMLQGGETNGYTRGQALDTARTGLPDLNRQVELCSLAEKAGISGVLVDFGITKPDSILMTAAMGLAARKIEFIVAYRSGLICPVSFVHQINTLSAIIGGRICINVVAGHSPAEQRAFGDFLDHNARYARTEEFLAVCNLLWNSEEPVNYEGTFYRVENTSLSTPYLSEGRKSPELFIAGNSPQAQDLAIRQGTLWMRMLDTPENIYRDAQHVLAAGREVGLRCSVICRPTRGEAVDARRNLLQGLDAADMEREGRFRSLSDSACIAEPDQLASTEWLSPSIWTGAVRTHGPTAAAITGTPADVADTIREYQQAGVSQFIFSGWPKVEEMIFFGTYVMPLLRDQVAQNVVA